MAKKRGRKHNVEYIAKSDKDEISLVLDSYEDIFSDFDPRAYSQKAVSSDFLQECRNAARDKNDEIELNFLVPESRRDKRDETVIRQRLKNHFQRHFLIEKKMRKTVIKHGFVWFLIGAALIFAASFIHSKPEYIYRLLIVITEPAGWFIAWTGLDKMLSTTKEKSPNFEFYKKMTKAKISFFNY